MTAPLRELPRLLLGYLSRHCRGPASARKAWKVAEDLRALGLDVGPQPVLDAVAGLGRQGFPVVATGGDVAAVYLDDRRLARQPARRETFHRPPRFSRTLRMTAMACALAAAEAAYAARYQAALRRADLPVMVAGDPGSVFLDGPRPGRQCRRRGSGRGRRPRRGPCPGAPLGKGGCDETQ